MKLTGGLIVGMLLMAISAFSQTNLNFTDIRVTPEGGIRMTWNSTTNEIYEIDYATDLVDTNTGTITWQTLYEYYPSQGSSTYWEDTGDMLANPLVAQPRDTITRFYRVALTGTNDPANVPQISILSPTNNSTLTGDVIVSVSVTSSLDVDTIRFFVDGAEVGYNAAAETNFILNTCQFANGPHTLFAVAGNSSGAETTDDANGNDYQENYGVSSPVTLTFNNLITDFNGKIRFMDPANGETNRFLANFAVAVDWTLQITNQAGVAVRTVTGSGTSMTYIWDGTGDGNTNLPTGPYEPVLSATQNLSLMMSMSLAASQVPPAISEALANGQTTYFVDSPPMPPVKVWTNGGWHFVPWEVVHGPVPPLEVPIPSFYLNPTATNSESGSTPMDGPLADPPSSQTTALRPLPFVWFGSVGTIGTAYQGNHPVTRWGANTAPNNGLSPFTHVTLNTSSPAGAYGTLKTAHYVSLGFNRFMSEAGYRLKFFKGNFDLHGNDLRNTAYGGSGIFDSVTLGLLVGHGVFGTDGDFTISGSGPKESYYPVYTGATGYDWVRLSQYQFGSTSTNLHWMAILSCNNLVPSVYSDCYNKEVLPVGDNLHLLCGAKTVIYIVRNFGLMYSAALTGRSSSITDRLPVKDSWFFAGHKTQTRQPGGGTHTVIFRVIGWPNCFDDDLVTNQDPASGNPADITFQDEQVAP